LPGSLAVGGLESNAGSTIGIRLGESAIDTISVEYYATIEGNLALTQINGQTAPDLFPLTFMHVVGERTGVFHSISGVQISSTRSLAVSYDDHNVYVAVRRPGDATEDGRVDFNDLVALAQNYSATPVQQWRTGDFTGDGKTNFNDLVLLAQNYGMMFGLDGEPMPAADFAADWALAQSMVPEPTTMLGFGAGLTLLARRR
jgi:hypothetical protein